MFLVGHANKHHYFGKQRAFDDLVVAFVQSLSVLDNALEILGNLRSRADVKELALGKSAGYEVVREIIRRHVENATRVLSIVFQYHIVIFRRFNKEKIERRELVLAAFDDVFALNVEHK